MGAKKRLIRINNLGIWGFITQKNGIIAQVLEESKKIFLIISK